MQPKLPALTGLRFWLALWVVVFHQTVEERSLVSLLSSMPGALRNLLQTGYVAVGFFFVLSGFVLAYSYSLAEPFDRARLRRFFAARFARIYPVYLLGILLVYPFMKYPPPAADAVRFWFDSTVLGLNLALLQAWIPQLAMTWNFPGWSLSNEAFFYAVFPFLGPLFWRSKSIRNICWTAAFLWLLALALPLWTVFTAVPSLGNVSGVQAGLEGPQPLANFLKFHPLLRLVEFLAGIVCARLYLLLQDSDWKGRGGALTGLSLLVITLAILNAHHIPFPLLHNGLLLPAVLCLILGLALGGGAAANFLAARPLVFLGNASYALYILHIGLAYWLASTGFAARSPLLFFAVYTALAIAASCAVYRWIEEPLNRALRRRLG